MKKFSYFIKEKRAKASLTKTLLQSPRAIIRDLRVSNSRLKEKILQKKNRLKKQLKQKESIVQIFA